MDVTQQEVLIERFWEAVGANGSRADLFGIVRSYKSLHGKAWARLQMMGDLTEEEWEFIADKLPEARRHALLHLADTYGNKHLMKRIKHETHKEMVHELLQGRTLSPADRVLRLEEEFFGPSYQREAQSEVTDLIALNPDVSLLRRLILFVAKSHLSEEERMAVLGRFLDTGKLTASDVYVLAWTNDTRNWTFPLVIPRLLDMQPSIIVLRGIVRRGNPDQCQAAYRQLLERFIDEHDAFELAEMLSKVEDKALLATGWAAMIKKKPKAEALWKVITGCSTLCFSAWKLMRKLKPTKSLVQNLINKIQDMKTLGSMRRYVRNYSAMRKKEKAV